MNVPKLRFPGFDGEWEEKTLNEVSLINRGKSKHRPRDAAHLYGGKYPFVQTGDIKNAYLYLTEYTQTYSEDGLKQSKLWNENTLCVTIAANIAETAILKIKACFPDSIIGLIPKEGETIVLFLKYQFDKFKIEIQKLSQGLAQDNLNQEKLSNVIFKFPSLPEQTKIASFLSAVDEKLQALKKKKELLQQYMQGIMQKIFAQEIRLKDDEGNDFVEWEEKSLMRLLREHKTRNIRNEVTEVFSVAKIKGVINQIEHLGRSYASKETSNYKVVYPNDIVYTKSPTSDFPFGIIKQNKLDRTGIVSVLYGVFTPVNKHIGLILDYYFANWKNTYNYLNPLVQKGAKNTMNIGNDDFLNGAELYLPVSEKEQIKISIFLLQIDKKIEQLESRIAGTEQYKRALLQQMFC